MTVLTSSVLIGRDDLVDHARRRLAQASSGDGQLLLVAGEAGIGKTRLAATIRELAESEGMTGFTAHAFRDDRAVTGAVLLDLAGLLRRHGSTAVRAIGRDIDALLESIGTSPSSGDIHHRRRLLIRNLADGLVALPEEIGPLVLVLEDLHWSDDLSLAVLAQVAHRLQGLRLLILATYRSDELYPRIPMREWRSTLVTQRLAEEIRPDRLSPEQIGAMISALDTGDLPPARETIATVARRSDGIPLHVEEIVAAMAAGDPETENLSEAVLSRAGRLTGKARAVAAAAAVIGRQFDLDLLAALLDEPAARLDRPLRELQDHHVVAASRVAGGTFDFKHALIRDALYRDVAPARRRTLHARVAAAAASAPGRAASAAFLSLHFEEAGDAPAAFRHAVEAGRAASDLGAHGEAMELYQRALRTAPSDLPDLDRATVMAGLAAEAAAADSNELAAHQYTKAAELFRRSGHTGEAADLMPALAAVRHLLGDPLPARLKLLMDAWEISADVGTRARVQAGICTSYMLDRHLDESIEAGELAVELAVEAGDRDTEIDIASSVGSCLIFAGRDSGWAMIRAGIADAIANGNEAHAARGYRMLSTSASMLVEYDTAESALADGIAFAERVELANHRNYMTSHLAHVRWAVGDWPAADRLAAQALADGRLGITTRHTSLFVRGFLALGRGRWAMATEALAEAHRVGIEMNEIQRIAPPLWGLAEAALLQGRLDEAVEHCRAGLAVSAPIRDAAYLFPFVVTGTRALLGRGERALAGAWVADTTAALEFRSIPGTMPALDHANGLLALHDGTTVQARERLERAEHRWRERRRTWEADWAGIDLARCALRANRDADALRWARSVRERAVARGALPLIEAADAILAAAADRRAVDEPWAPLTAREFEVARLVAEGRTNPEIAVALRISPRTAGAHVAHILARLGVGRRAEIAAWVSTVSV